MKKLISGIIVGILVTSTATAFAASNIKSVYFNDNVKLQVNGRIIASEILTATKEGQVNASNYVSARALAESMGGTVDWKNNTIIITSNLKKNEAGYDLLKLYSRISNQYKNLDELGNLISMTSTGLDLSLREVIISNKLDRFQEVYSDYTNTTIKKYNENIKEIINIQKESSENGINLSDMNTIMSNYKNSLDQYGLAFLNLVEYASDLSNYSLNNYTTAESAGYSCCLEGSKIADDGYNKFYSLVQNYK